LPKKKGGGGGFGKFIGEEGCEVEIVDNSNIFFSSPSSEARFRIGVWLFSYFRGW
jgi:hypothetical protein